MCCHIFALNYSFFVENVKNALKTDFTLSSLKEEVISNAHNFTLSAPLNVAPPGVGKIPPILTNEAFKINSFHWLITEQKRVLWVNSTHTGLIYYFYGQNTCMFTYAHL